MTSKNPPRRTESLRKASERYDEERHASLAFPDDEPRAAIASSTPRASAGEVFSLEERWAGL